MLRLGPARLLQARVRSYTTDARRLVVGCGSNVVDRFFRVRALPKPGEKGFFQSPTKILEDSIVGGVTLNHLSWAAQLGVPTGLLAFQGEDVSGALVRAKMQELGVLTDFVKVDKKFTTAESYVFLQPDGERSIIMASGATSMIDGEAMKTNFSAVASGARIVSTEISQVPLSGVNELLRAANEGGALSILDIDVSPSVAVKEARLGSIEELLSSVRTAQVLKPAKHAAQELLAVLQPDLANKVASMSSQDLTARLREVCNVRLVALTSGSEGCVLATADEVVTTPSFKIDKVVDATGAGDAFLGGLIAAIYHSHGTRVSLQEVAHLANATGAACCGILGALPNASGRNQVRSLLEEVGSPFLPIIQPDNGDDEPDLAGFTLSLKADLATVASAVPQSALADVAKFIKALQDSKGKVFTTGLGKSGHVAARMAASLTSTGLPAQYIHASEWVHGDLGALRSGDAVVLLSNSGNTKECVDLIPHLRARDVRVLSIVGNASSALAHQADAKIVYDVPPGIEPVGGAPTSSVIAQEMVINAVVCELIERTGFSQKDFAKNHPGGVLGQANAPKHG